MKDSMNMKNSQDQKILPFVEKKIMQRDFEDLYDSVGYKRHAEKLQLCGKLISVPRCSECGKTITVKVFYACQLRMCPVCAMRKSRVTAGQSLAALEWIGQQHTGYSLHMVTLTQKNVRWGSLAQEIDQLMAAMKKMLDQRPVKRAILGMARSVEITVNYKRKEWHPHVHMIIILKDGHEEFTTKKKWKKLWRGLMNLDYDPVVDVRKLQDDAGAVYEVSKYVTKLGDLLEGPRSQVQKCLIELTNTLHKRRLLAWSGVWREARKVLKQKSVDEMNQEELDEKIDACPDCGGEIVDALMVWSGNTYVPCPEPMQPQP